MNDNNSIQPGQYSQFTPLRNQAAAERVVAVQTETKRSDVSGESVKALVQNEMQRTQPQIKATEPGSAEKTQKAFEQTLDGLNQSLQQTKSTLKFAMHEDYGKMVIEVKDEASGDVIRQIPSDQFLAVAENINQFLERSRFMPGDDGSPPTGLFANEQA
ncbi:MAG: flagellar protein FlaG [Hydrogenovibrio sp.]|uniref:flagellar protein FlaG n=1 Tax=Hydrogenovibrio sp. TaxID=2065821 RepID=UPI00286FDC3D|nr:flagellar protein FlaG [Hydrogenovibrio sp.]MDR9499591.1 flagellar protein FlaG [Hydrogenovibrio sp.]